MCIGSVEEKLKKVSSANNRAKEVKSSEISLIYNRNNKGPNTEPWGTPALIDLNSEEKPLSDTF